MKKAKLSLINIQGQLSRIEMKNIMAGSGSDDDCAIFHYTGCNDCDGPNKTCDYWVKKPDGSRYDFCDEGCFSDCETEGCMHVEC